MANRACAICHNLWRNLKELNVWKSESFKWHFPEWEVKEALTFSEVGTDRLDSSQSLGFWKISMWSERKIFSFNCHCIFTWFASRQATLPSVIGSKYSALCHGVLFLVAIRFGHFLFYCNHLLSIRARDIISVIWLSLRKFWCVLKFGTVSTLGAKTGNHHFLALMYTVWRTGTHSVLQGIKGHQRAKKHRSVSCSSQIRVLMYIKCNQRESVEVHLGISSFLQWIHSFLPSVLHTRIRFLQWMD